MSKIQACHPKESDWIVANSDTGHSTSNGASRLRHPGSAVEPQMIEVKVFADQRVSVHAHETGECFYIVRGEMQFGKHTLKAGDSIFVPGLTPYSFKGGPEGVEFVNFRPRQDLTHFSSEEVQTMKKMPQQERTEFIAQNIEKTKAYYNMVD